MQYRKGNQTEDLESLPMIKVRLVRHGVDGEGIWARQGPDYVALQNNALHFMPFHSWGAIIPSKGDDGTDIRETIDLKDFDPEKEGIELHPEAWKDYVKDEVIDLSGNYIYVEKSDGEQEGN